MNNSYTEEYMPYAYGYGEDLAEALSLELERDSRRYSADFEQGGE